jgi:hypothetical protein
MSKTMFTGYTVRVDGLDSLMRWLKDSNPKMHKALRQGLKEAASPVLRAARANARRIQDDGTYAGSLSIASRKNGAQYVLKSTDPNAGVKEFAREGAVMVKSRAGTERSQRMVAEHARVGVPHRANAPRVMVPAIADSADDVRNRIEERIAEALKEVEHG